MTAAASSLVYMWCPRLTPPQPGKGVQWVAGAPGSILQLIQDRKQASPWMENIF